MQHHLISLTLLLSTILSFSAHADFTTALDTPLLDVAAEKYPNESYKLGITVDEHNQVSQMFFTSTDYRVNFSVQEMHDGVVLLASSAKNPITGRTKNFDIIILQAEAPTPTTPATVYLSYLYNGLTMKYVYTKVPVAFNPETKTYQVQNDEGEKLTKAFISTRFWTIFGHKFEVGIRSIDLIP